MSNDVRASGCVVDYMKDSKRQEASVGNSLEGSGARCGIGAPAAQRS